MATIDQGLATFRADIPELATTSDADVRRWLTIAGDIYSATARGMAWLAAHLLTVDAAGEANDGGDRIVVSERVGDISRTYARGTQAAGTPNASDSFYMSTVYGRVYLQLRSHATARSIRVV